MAGGVKTLNRNRGARLYFKTFFEGIFKANSLCRGSASIASRNERVLSWVTADGERLAWRVSVVGIKSGSRRWRR